ncbi:MAG: hypothetical protein GY801_01730 [bacterium]|nr:hypothetical protein [bacterium]
MISLCMSGRVVVENAARSMSNMRGLLTPADVPRWPLLTEQEIFGNEDEPEE